jgi:hypothetical protein
MSFGISFYRVSLREQEVKEYEENISFLRFSVWEFRIKEKQFICGIEMASGQTGEILVRRAVRFSRSTFLLSFLRV